MEGLLKARGGATLPEIYSALNLTRGNVSRILADLITARKVERRGVRRKYVYVTVRQGLAAGPMSSVFDLVKESS